MAVDEDRDIAVLSVPPTLAGMPGLSLARTPPKVGDAVFALGSPKGLEFTFTKGIVSQFRRNFAPYGAVVQTDVSLSPGSSGSPLVDHHGQVVGINTLASRTTAEAHNLNFAVSAEEIVTVCKSEKTCPLSRLKSFLEYEPQQTLTTPGKQERDSDNSESEASRKEAERKRLEAEHEAEAQFNKLLDDVKKQTAERERAAAPWRQLEVGMSSAQVERLLGRPNDVHTYPVLDRTDWDYRYADHISRYEGHVDFHNDRLSGWREPMKWGGSY